jgi:Ig-like domain from next to BRCA1 gene
LRVQERMKMQKIKSILIMMIVALTLAACGGNQAATPTISVADVQTMAVSTFASGLTQTAEAMPTNTPTITSTAANTVVATFASLNANGTPETAVGDPTASCYGLVFKSDVTIPDDTNMTPGQQFTKTWLVQNTGSCAWQPGFKWSLVAGNPMGGSTVTLTQAVSPGAQYQVSVPMVAPNTAGESTGTWKMADTNGTFFGEAPWVKVKVTNAVTTVTASTPSVTPTSTP